MHFKSSIILLALTATSIAGLISRPAEVRALKIRDPSVEKGLVSELNAPSAGIEKRGFAASQARYLELTAKKSDLELQRQFILDDLQEFRDIGLYDSIYYSLLEQLENTQAQIDAVQMEIDRVIQIIGKNLP